ncbi:hypothetical protein RHMOL_Rhmol01G0180400 [Rhododendron molle]|uniref:Uncharacterized protein n=1 Tax=Rhododendron molle TaxID=49168 RepID=A0ACC0Q430_RHOML|nr:hypothetical protein RHMOL_Rhmol01G0180400 [Rhododendron molle]
MGTRSGGTMVRYGLFIRGEEPMLIMCANGNPERRNHSHGVTLCDPDILCWWRRWYNVSDLIDKLEELYTLETFGAEELARMEEEKELLITLDALPFCVI